MGKNLEDMVANSYKNLVISDLHIPFQDNSAINCMLNYAKQYKPDRVIVNGDLVDFYSISDFDKCPERRTSIQAEVLEARAFLKKLRHTVGKDTRIDFLHGNHENRLQRFVWKNSELVGLDALELGRLLQLGLYDIKETKVDRDYWSKMMGEVKVGGTVIMHGDGKLNRAKYSSNSGYAAFNTLRNRIGESVIIGHCFDEDTEILTKRGWIKRDKLLKEDIVGSVNKNMIFEWNEIEKIHDFDNFTEMVHIKSVTTDILVTKKHGIIYFDRNNNWQEAYAEDLLKMSRFTIPNAAGYQKRGAWDNDLDLFLIQCVADGSIEGNSIRFHLKKKRKIDRILYILQKNDIDYKLSQTKAGGVKINAHVGKEFLDKWFPNRKKVLGRWVLKMDAKRVLYEYSITDGNKNKCAKNSYQVSSAKEEEIDLLQELFVMSGMRTSKIKRKDSNNFVLTINTRNKTVMRRQNVSIEKYSGSVWCVTVPNGNVIIRRNGKTSITKNTHRLAQVFNLIGNKQQVGIEDGCLCESTRMNWQQGFVTFETYRGKSFNYRLHPIDNGKIIEDGKLYK